jgi:anti-sigma factor RsiW
MEHPEHILILNYIDGLLPDSDVRALEAHIAICRSCSRAAERERALSTALRSQELSRPSSSFDRRVLDTIIPATAHREGERSLLRRHAGLLVLCVMTVAIVLLSSGESSSSTSWFRPVQQAISAWLQPTVARVSDAVTHSIDPVREVAHRGSSVIEIFALALLGLAALAVLDRLISPRLRKSRFR